MSIAFTLAIGLYLLTQTQAQTTQTDFDCNVVYSCAGEVIASDATLEIVNLNAFGYNSAFSSYVDVTTQIDCGGSHSCYQTDRLATASASSSFGIECGGDLSCSRSDNITTPFRVACDGSNACNNVSTETRYINCDGDGACANSTISGIDANERPTYAAGAYSMSNSLITSAGNVELNMEGYYAGYGATFHCQTGHECTIKCNANACEMLYLQCDGNCVVNNNSIVTVAPITDISMMDLSETVFLYDSVAISTEANTVCDLVSNLQFDNLEARDGGGDITTATDAICCRGKEACRNISSIVSTSEYPILCSGEDSCRNVDEIFSADDLICSGVESCQSSYGLMADGNIYCLGESSCSSSNITVSDEQSLYCSGQYACYEAGPIDSNGSVSIYFLGYEAGYDAVVNCLEGDECNIVCGGYDSCYDLTVNCDGFCSVQCDEDTKCPEIISANPTMNPTDAPTRKPTVDPSVSPTEAPTKDTIDVDCNAAFQCEQRNVSNNATHLIEYFTASGYKSAVAAYVNVSKGIACAASHSCHQTQTLASTLSVIDCSGDLSCFGSDNVNTSTSIWCSGSNACSHANLESNQFEFYGDSACANSNISLQPYASLLVSGAYSLSNSLITSAGTPNGFVTLFMEGYYAGYGATFHCQTGDVCTIFCQANACAMMYLQCDDNCVIYNNSNVTVAPITDMSMRRLSESETVFLYDSLAISTDANNICDMTGLTFDDFEEKRDGADITTATDAICCRGSAACRNISSIVSTSEYPILCSGGNSCQNADEIVSADDLICSGASSCQSANDLKADGNIYCLGEKSCRYSNITVSDEQSLYCSGESACDETQIQSNGSVDIYFLGYDSGEDAVVNCLEGDECNIVCGGPDSCDDLTVNCDGLCSVECDEDTDCPRIISANPTPSPTEAPTVSPLTAPTVSPTPLPTVAPSQPTSSPSAAPTNAPTSAPSMSPVDSSDSDSGSGSDSDSDEIAMALFSAQRTDENVDEYAGAKQYHLTVGLSSTSWMQLWAIFGALMILNVICFFMYCRKKAN